MKINSNITALMTMTHMNKANNNTSSAMQRLSSGFKINKASDNPAGWAIANQLTGQTNGLKQANRNTMDGISLVQTTEGALNEVNAMLNRIRDLCVEAVNDSNTGSDRQNMQDEIDELIKEINDITQRTDFNGIQILNNKQNVTIQTGANAYEMLELSGEATSMSNVLTDLVGFNILKLKDSEAMPPLKELLKEYTTDRSVIDEIQAVLNDTDPANNDTVKKNKIHQEIIHPSINPSNHNRENVIQTGDVTTNDLIRNIEDTIYNKEQSYISTNDAMSIIANLYIPQEGTKEYEAVQKNCSALLTIMDDYNNGRNTASVALDKLHDIVHPTHKEEQATLRKTDDAMINTLITDIEALVKPGGGASGDTNTTIINKVNTRIQAYEQERYTTLTQKLQEIMNTYETDNKNIQKVIYDPLQETIKECDSKIKATTITPKEGTEIILEKLTEVISQDEANEKDILENAINKIDVCITKVTDIRSMLGAYQNRMEHIVANLGVSEENVTESLSRIQDTDMAEEITEYTTQNVVAQVGISMLTQANQIPQQILQILAQS